MTRRTLKWLVIAGLLASSTAVAGLPAGHVQAASAPAAATQYAAGTTGAVPLVHNRPAPKALAKSGARSSAQHGTRTFRSHAATAGTAGPAPAAAQAAASTSVLLHNFNGVSSNDSRVTNYGLQFEPPDQGLCVGNGFVLEPVNSAYRVYRTNGSTVVGPFNVNDIFNVGGEEFTSDPRCYYDAPTNRWFVVILFINSTSTASSVDVAVSATGDPTGFWNEYVFDTTDRRSGCPCFGDQPTLGIDHDNLYFTTNEFSILGPQFYGAQVYAVSKADLVASRTAHFVHFGNLSIGGAVANSIQPALTTGSSKAEYFLSALDPNGTFDNRIGVWAMTNTTAVASGHSPTLSSRVLTSEPYGVPPKAQQKGSSSLLDSGDDRMQQTQFINGRLWGSLTTAVTIPNDNAERAGAAWFSVVPTLSGSVVGPSTIAQQGYVVEAGHYVLYPSIQSDGAGHAAMGITLTGVSMYPSAAYASLEPHHSSFGAVVVSAAGSGPYDPKATRWGDYSWAVLDPSGNGFWFANEYIPPKASQTPNGLRNWGTRVVEVCAC